MKTFLLVLRAEQHGFRHGPLGRRSLHPNEQLRVALTVQDQVQPAPSFAEEVQPHSEGGNSREEMRPGLGQPRWVLGST